MIHTIFTALIFGLLITIVINSFKEIIICIIDRKRPNPYDWWIPGILAYILWLLTHIN